jgi:hypothetical protein
MANRYLYVETAGAYNFRVEIREQETRPESSIIWDWVQQVQRAGVYYHEEDKTVFPWHSILQVTLKEDKR